MLQSSLGFLIAINTGSPNLILKLYSSGWRHVSFLNPIYLYSIIFLSKITWLSGLELHTQDTQEI